MKRLSVLLLTLLILLTSCGELHYVETETPETTESPAEGWTPADLSTIDGIDSVFSNNERLIYGNWIFEADAETFVVYDMESGKYFTFELE